MADISCQQSYAIGLYPNPAPCASTPEAPSTLRWHDGWGGVVGESDTPDTCTDPHLAVDGVQIEDIARILPEPEASLLTGTLLGEESGIPEGVGEPFSTTGTTHVISISGFNLQQTT